MIIMTSTCRFIKKQPTVGYQPRPGKGYEQMKDRLMEDLKRTFRPEFLNRVDDIIVFRSLTEEDIKKIVDILLDELSKRISEYDLNLDVTPEAKELLAKEGFDPTYGARPLRRVIQKRLEDGISEEMLRGNFTAGDTIKVSLENEKLKFSKV